MARQVLASAGGSATSTSSPAPGWSTFSASSEAGSAGSFSSGLYPSSTASSSMSPAQSSSITSSSTSSELPVSVSVSTPALQSTSTQASSTGSGGPASLAPSNRSPITLYDSPPRQFKPDRLASIDLIIVVIYICLLLSTSISTMIRTKKSQKRKAALASANGLSPPLAGSSSVPSRKMNWLAVGISIFASNMGSEHFIGLSGSAAATGISVAAFELHALILLQLATALFMPVLIVSKISTLPEYMSKRFGGRRIRTYLALMSILLYILTKISVNLYSAGIFLQQAVGWNLYSSALFILALTSVMTLTGGIKGAMLIDRVQAVIMTVGAATLSFRAMSHIGGWDALRRRYSLAVPTKVPANLTHCAEPLPRAFQLLRPADDKNMPWLGFIVGQTWTSLWYWAGDQMLVARFLSARSLAHVQGAGVLGGYFKVLPVLFMVVPGMISRCLYTDEVACVDPSECQKYCQSSVSCSNTAYPRLVLELMPTGARGIMLAAMVAALICDLSNIFNGATGLFSCDIYQVFRKNSSQKERDTAGRLFVFCLVGASIMWIPVIQEMQGGQLFIYIQAITSMFTPPTCAVYVCAILFPRTNETSAFWSMMLGFVLGTYRLVLSFLYKEPSCGTELDTRPWILKDVHYMYYAGFLFFATFFSVLIISHLTKPPAPFRLIRSSFWTRFDTGLRQDDKNVFEMSYSAKAAERRNKPEDASQAGAQSDPLKGSSGSLSSQQRLTTIQEQEEKKAADLSSVVVDIQEAARGVGLAERASSQARGSLATGKLLASKLVSSDLKGAKSLVKAALGGDRIKFMNLNDDDDDDEHEHVDGGHEDDDERAGDRTNENNGGAAQNKGRRLKEEASSTAKDEEPAQAVAANRKQSQKRAKRQKSVLSAFSTTFNLNRKSGGYKKAAEFDEDDEYDDEDDDEDESGGEDEQMSLNKRARRKRQQKAAAGARLAADESANDTDRSLTPTPAGSRASRQPGASEASSGQQGGQANRAAGDYQEAGRLDQELGARHFKCFDNTTSLLIKTRTEQFLLRIAMSTSVVVAFGLYILFSLPSNGPPKEFVDILMEKIE